MSRPDNDTRPYSLEELFAGPASCTGENLGTVPIFEERVRLGAEERADRGEEALGELLKEDTTRVLDSGVSG